MPWKPPSLVLKWGPYTKPDPEEQNKTVTAVQGALGGASGQPIITLKMAVEKLKQSGTFDIDNVDAVVDELTKQAKEKAAKEAEDAEVTATRDHEQTIEQIEVAAKAKPQPGKR